MSIGLWLNPIETSPFATFFVVLGYGDGSLNTLPLVGNLDRPGWNFVKADIPQNIDPPFHIVAFQVYEPTLAQGTPGQILIDGIHVTSPRVQVEYSWKDLKMIWLGTQLKLWGKRAIAYV